jgi:aspartate/methionine/tyrosine aminotransferase
MELNPSLCESGYFLTLDISKNKDLIPPKYFNPNFETDPLVLIRKFPKEVPLDYAFCRYLAVEKGIALMPLSAFCLEESPHKMETMARMAICKRPETFRDLNLAKQFALL